VTEGSVRSDKRGVLFCVTEGSVRSDKRGVLFCVC